MGRCPRPKRPLGSYRYVRLRWRVLFALVDLLGYALFGMAQRLGGRGKSSDRGQTVRSILLVQLDHLGDAVLSTGMLAALRSAYPHATIDVLASSSNSELFQACPEVRRVYVSQANRLSRSSRAGWVVSTIFWGCRLRRERYDLAIDARGDFPAVAILWLSGAGRRLGWACGGGGFLLTDQPAFVWGRHEVRSRQALVDTLGIASRADQIAWAPRFAVDIRWQRWASQQLTAWRDPQRPLVALHCGAGTEAKRWPNRHLQELLGRLILELNAQVLLVGSSADVNAAEAILYRRTWPGVEDWTGRLTIVQLAAVLQQCDVVVGADSGPAHLAAALGKPAVVLFSGTNRVEQWRPWGPQVVVLRHSVPCAPCHRQQCPLADHPCMTGLMPHDVVQAVAETLTDRRLAAPAAFPTNRLVPLTLVTERTPS